MQSSYSFRNFVIVVIWCGAISFFPAHFGYLAERSWVGYISTVIFALMTYVPRIRDRGQQWIFALLSLCLFGLIIESIGVVTCRPYGCFAYSHQLGPKLFDIVPYLLVFTWPPLVIGVRSVVKNTIWRWWKRWLVWWVWLVAVDLILDPLAVLMGIWSYPGWGFRFGVPLSNSSWWMISGTIGMMIIDMFFYHKREDKKIFVWWLMLNISFFVGYGLRRITL